MSSWDADWVIRRQYWPIRELGSVRQPSSDIPFEKDSNHILWHAGHGLWLQDLMCVDFLSGRSELPKGWAETFGANSQPATIHEWPSRDEVRSLLQSQLGRMLDLLDETPVALLSETPTRFRDNRTTLGWIVHGLHDEAKHNGEMYLLWKLHRLRA
jgi:hypothetical protein